MNPSLASSLFLSCAPLFAQDTGLAQETASGFPESTALAAGLDPAALERLDALARELAESGEVVGSELLVLVKGEVILHEGYGLRDQEAGHPMGTDNVFCVRSMTKPVIATAILMLVEERKLRLSDRVSEILPALDVEGWQGITLQHLLSHTTGLPFSLIAGRRLDTLEDIQQIAAFGADYALEFEPGSDFQYSDQGVDTLTAVIEVVTGGPASVFVHERILQPLGMQSSACVLEGGSPLRDRALPAYLGTPGEWSRFWGPDEAAAVSDLPRVPGAVLLRRGLRALSRHVDERWARGPRSLAQEILDSQSASAQPVRPCPQARASPT